MKQFTIELDETICTWLEHISTVTGESVEKIIADGIYHQVTLLEDGILRFSLIVSNEKYNTTTSPKADRHRRFGAFHIKSGETMLVPYGKVKAN